MRDRCASIPNGPIIAILDAELLILCPSFWKLPDEPPNALCPRLRRGIWRPNDSRLVVNKYAAVIHELAVMYIAQDQELKDKKHWAEVAKVMDAVELSPGRSAASGVNYAFYAAGEWTLQRYYSVKKVN